MTPETSEEALDGFVDKTSDGLELTALLAETLHLYEGRGTNQVIRMRGYILAAFERAGLPEAALPYVLEELESGHSAYLIAAAAKAVRGLTVPSSDLPA